MIIGEVWPWTLESKENSPTSRKLTDGGKGERQIDMRWGWGWGGKRALLKENP